MKTILLAELDDGSEWLAADLRTQGYRVVVLDKDFTLSEYFTLSNLGIARMPWPDLIVSDAQVVPFGQRSPRRMFVLVVGSGSARTVRTPLTLDQLHEAIATFLEPSQEAPAAICAVA